MRFRFPHQGSQASRGSRPGRPIARRLNLDRKTVRRFRDTALDQLLASARERRPIGVLEPFKAYLNTHFTEAQGQVDGTQLSLEIQARGYRGSRQVVRKHLAALGRAPHCRSEPMSPAQARSHPGSCGQGSCRLATGRLALRSCCAPCSLPVLHVPVADGIARARPQTTAGPSAAPFGAVGSRAVSPDGVALVTPCSAELCRGSAVSSDLP